MPRRLKVEKRSLIPDYRFKDRMVTQFISSLMKSGKRSTAERCLYSAIDQLEKKSGQSGLELFHKALNNVKPVLEVRSRRVGGATYQVPIEVNPERGQVMAIRWLVGFARARTGKPMAEKLAAEIINAAQGEGPTIKKRQDTHRMAEANKAFAHYRW